MRGRLLFILVVYLFISWAGRGSAAIITYTNWTDVNKYSDRGLPNPEGSLDDSDSLMCWAATSSNVLNFTGWTWDRDGDGALELYDDVYHEFLAEFENQAGGGAMAYEHYVNKYWGDALSLQGETWLDYFHQESNDSILMQTVAEFMNYNFGIYVSITNDSGTLGHAITAWGYETDADGNFIRIAVTNSDRGYVSGVMVPMLQWYNVSFNADNSRWYLTDYGTDVYMRRIDAFAQNSLLADVPEPVTLVLFVFGLAGLARTGRRMKK